LKLVEEPQKRYYNMLMESLCFSHMKERHAGYPAKI
jgi:hypothetical protein